MNFSFKQRLYQKQLLIGTILTLPTPEIAEICGIAGLDWLFVDLEHSTLDIKDAQRILHAAGGVPCAFRVPSLDETWIKKALDIGAAGIIVPQVRSIEDAKAAVRFCRYPPDGCRSVGIARAQGYGQNFEQYVASSNDDIAVILQIEHEDAVTAIEHIIHVPGIDALFLGPYDLSASMGKTGLVTDPDVQEAMNRVRRHAQISGIPLGVFGVSPESVKPFIRLGYSLIAVGIDTLIFGNAMKQITGSLNTPEVTVHSPPK